MTNQNKLSRPMTQHIKHHLMGLLLYRVREETRRHVHVYKQHVAYKMTVLNWWSGSSCGNTLSKSV